MARRTDDVLVSVACDDAELAVLDEMRRSGAVDSNANLMRIALWSLADHLGLNVPSGVFDLRPWGGHVPRTGRTAVGKSTYKRKPNPKIRQHEPPRKNHPWRHKGSDMLKHGDGE